MIGSMMQESISMHRTGGSDRRVNQFDRGAGCADPARSPAGASATALLASHSPLRWLTAGAAAAQRVSGGPGFGCRRAGIPEGVAAARRTADTRLPTGQGVAGPVSASIGIHRLTLRESHGSVGPSLHVTGMRRWFRSSMHGSSATTGGSTPVSVAARARGLVHACRQAGFRGCVHRGPAIRSRPVITLPSTSGAALVPGAGSFSARR